MARVTVEGTITPSTYLARGARLTVERTPYLEKLIRKGFVKVVGTQPAVEEVRQIVETQIAASQAESELAPTPPRNARRDVWAAFLVNEGIPYEDSDTRDELIERWDAAFPDADEPADG